MLDWFIDFRSLAKAACITLYLIILCLLIFIGIKFPIIGVIEVLYVTYQGILFYYSEDDGRDDDKETMYERYRKCRERFEGRVNEVLTQENKGEYHFRLKFIMKCMVENFYTIRINDDLTATYVCKPCMGDRHLAWNYFKQYVHDSNLMLDYLLHRYNLSMGFTDWFIDLDVKKLWEQDLIDDEQYYKKVKSAYRKKLRKELFHIPFIFWKMKRVVFLNRDYLFSVPLMETLDELNLKVIENSDGELFVTHKK